MTLPALFIAHGSPLLSVESSDYTQFLNQLGEAAYSKGYRCFYCTLGLSCAFGDDG